MEIKALSFDEETTKWIVDQYQAAHVGKAQAEKVRDEVRVASSIEVINFCLELFHRAGVEARWGEKHPLLGWGAAPIMLVPTGTPG